MEFITSLSTQYRAESVIWIAVMCDKCK